MEKLGREGKGEKKEVKNSKQHSWEKQKYSWIRGISKK